MIHLHSQDVRVGSGLCGGGQRRIDTLHLLAFLCSRRMCIQLPWGRLALRPRCRPVRKSQQWSLESSDENAKPRDRYLLYDPLDSIVYISIPINLVCHRDLAHMLDLRFVPLCSYESVAGLQHSSRSIFLPEGAKNGTTCHSGRPVRQQGKDRAMECEFTYGNFDISNTIVCPEGPHSVANVSLK